MDDDTLPVIDLTEEELAAPADSLEPVPVVEVPPVPWRLRRSPRWVRRTTLAMLLTTVVSTAFVGTRAWSAMGRGVAVYTGPRAGDFADRLHCAEDPRVKNDLSFARGYGNGGERLLPTPPWLRDRSFGAAKLRTAHDAARWSNANADAAATFRKTAVAAWDEATRLQLARAESWMRSWWSRYGDTAPSGWTEDSAVDALRRAVREDRFLTEDLARSVKGTLRWRPVAPVPGRESADTVAIGGFQGSQLAEVLVYRRGADGFLRVWGRAYCDHVDEPDRALAGAGVAGAAGAAAAQPAGPSVGLSCTAGPLWPEPLVVTETSHGAPRPSRPPDGHTWPLRPPTEPPRGVHRLPPGPEPALTPASAIAQYGQSGHWPAGTVGANLAYEVAWADSTQAIAVGRHDGQVKVIVDLRRRTGGWWSTSTRESCVHDLHRKV